MGGDTNLRGTGITSIHFGRHDGGMTAWKGPGGAVRGVRAK